MATKDIMTGVLYAKQLDENNNIIGRVPMMPKTLSDCVIYTSNDNNGNYYTLNEIINKIINGDYSEDIDLSGYVSKTGNSIITGNLTVNGLYTSSLYIDGQEIDGSDGLTFQVNNNNGFNFNGGNITLQSNYKYIGDGSGLTNINTNNIEGILPITQGGTGATTAANARTNLGLGSLSTLNSLSLTDNKVTDILPISKGGTGLNPSISVNDYNKVLRVNSTGNGFELSDLFNSETINVKSNTINLNRYNGDSSGEVLINASEGDLKLKANGTINIDGSANFSKDVNINDYLMLGLSGNSILSIYNETSNSKKYIIIDRYNYVISENTEIDIDGTTYKASEKLNKIINYINRTNNYRIYLLPGAYKTDEPITENCTIIGLGSQDDVYIMSSNRTSIIKNARVYLENLTLSHFDVPAVPSGSRPTLTEAAFYPLVESKEVYLDNVTFELMSWSHKCMYDGACIKITGKDLSEYRDPVFISASGGDSYKFIVNNHIMNCKFRIDGGTISDKKMISITKGDKTYMEMENNSITNNIIMYPSSKYIAGNFYFSDVRRSITINIDYNVIKSDSGNDISQNFFIQNNNTIKGNSNMYIFTSNNDVSYSHFFSSYEIFTTNET